jgi:protein gp37
MKRYPQSELHFDKKELKTDLGSGNKIFVGSSCDMWAEDVPTEWIYEILSKCRDYDNTYLFQTKNPYRFRPAILGVWELPDKAMIGITLETNRDYHVSKAIPPKERAQYFAQIQWLLRMVSIEPIMDFDLPELARLIRIINPEFVSIGADSGHNNLPEPSGDKVKALIEALKAFTEVKIKDNLKRLLNEQV